MGEHAVWGKGRGEKALDSPFYHLPISWECLPLAKPIQRLSDTWIWKITLGPLTYRAEQGTQGVGKSEYKHAKKQHAEGKDFNVFLSESI